MDLLQEFLAFLWAAWSVTAEMAPYLLFGFFVAGLLSVFVSPEWVERHLGGTGFAAVAKGVLFGVPLPLCSCGVIAVTASMRRHGASKGATTGFLLSTPQTGVDSIAATWGMLGPALGVYRPIAALITGLAGGALVSLFDRGKDDAAPAEASGSDCGEDCCDKSDGGNRWLQAIRYAFITLPRDIGNPLVVGILLAGVIGAITPQGLLAPYLDGGFVAMLAMIAVGIPLYVCATASIPLAIGFIHLGASPGAALAFLIAGPATNVATIAMVWKVLGARTAAIYLGAMAVGAVLSGLGFDALLAAGAQWGLPETVMEHHEHMPWWNHVLGVALLLVVLGALAPIWQRRLGKLSGNQPEETQAPEPEGDAAMKEAKPVRLRVTGMTCSHCEAAVSRSLSDAPGVAGVQVDRVTGETVIEGDGLNPENLKNSVEQLGYDVVILEPSGG